MIETILGLIFLLTFACMAMVLYSRRKNYQEIKRLVDIAAPREDDLKWSLKYTTVAYGVRNKQGIEGEL